MVVVVVAVVLDVVLVVVVVVVGRVVVVVDDVVVVAGVHGVPVASEVRNGVKSTLAVTLSQPALPGPAAQPHQLFSASPSVGVDALVTSLMPFGVFEPSKYVVLMLKYDEPPRLLMNKPTSEPSALPEPVLPGVGPPL